jgi:hypothetical protein
MGNRIHSMAEADEAIPEVSTGVRFGVIELYGCDCE